MGKTPYLMHCSTEEARIMPKNVTGYLVWFAVENLSDGEETPAVGIYVSSQNDPKADIVDIARKKLVRRIRRLEA